MELISFIKDICNYNYDMLIQVLESEPYNLKVKEDIETPELFLIHNTDKSNVSLKIVRECNGIILEKSTFKILCYTFDKCIDCETFDKNINLDNLYIEKAIEGTLLRLYYYNDQWRLSSKKCINAYKSKWLSEKNFGLLFEECINYNEIITKLDINYCYSFILTHPENKIVVNYDNPNAYHISTRDLRTIHEIDINIDVQKTIREFINKDNLEGFITNNITNDNILNLQTLINEEGVVFIDNAFNRQKVRTPIFNKVRNLWGNTNNRFYRYLELRCDVNALNEYLTYFIYDKEQFLDYEKRIGCIAQSILELYISKHIKKENIKIPYFFSKIIYNLHGDFIKTKVVTNYNKIMLVLLETPPKKIMFMINHLIKHNNYLNNPENAVDNKLIEENMEL